MSDAFTAKNYPIAKAPKRITLLGDKTKKPEPAQHIIEFPGGAIEVSRCSDGSYWAHILITQQNVCGDLLPGRAGAYGVVVDSRIQNMDGDRVASIPNEQTVEQIAVLIRPASERPFSLERSPNPGPTPVVGESAAQGAAFLSEPVGVAGRTVLAPNGSQGAL